MKILQEHINDFQNNTNKSHMGKYEDAIVAISYIIDELRHNNINDLATILDDITQVHMHTKNATSEEQQHTDEYQSILYVYFIEKYFNKIKVQSYKNEILDFFKNQILIDNTK